MSYRHEAAAEHAVALDNLIVAIMTDLTEVAARVGRQGTDPAFVFAGAVPEGYDPGSDDFELSEDDYMTFCETLGSLTIADSTGITEITGKDEALWPEAVDLWAAVRSALGHRFSTDIDPGLVIDTTHMCAAAWNPLYCPDVGPEPDMIVSFQPDDPDDPFSQLLLDNDANLEQCSNRIIDLMVRYGLDEPTTESHPAGAHG